MGKTCHLFPRAGFRILRRADCGPASLKARPRAWKVFSAADGNRRVAAVSKTAARGISSGCSLVVRNLGVPWMARNPSRNHEDELARHLSMNRRRFLRGVGACVALPALPSLLPRSLRAAEAAATSTPAQIAARVPQRMAFVTVPNGVNLEKWWPKGEGKNFELAPTMESLAGVKDQLQVIAGLDHINATAGRDGPGDHARANASLLTGCRAKKTSGADIKLGPSVDQIAAEHLGHLSRFKSLELTCDTDRSSGSCDSGYACAYQYNVSWRSATMPMAAEANPRRVFERLFGTGTA